MGENAEIQALLLAEDLRNRWPALTIRTHCGAGNFKKQLKKADSSGARLALVLGEAEIANNTVGIKYLREHRDQLSLSRDDLMAQLPALLDAQD
jgi:histidyl-tRNA synthetase